MADPISVFDCDGHIIESIPEMVQFLGPVDRDVALTPSRNRHGVFASLDDFTTRATCVNRRGRNAAPEDRMDRDDNVYTTSTGHRRSLTDYLASGQVLVGCEGNCTGPRA